MGCADVPIAKSMTLKWWVNKEISGLRFFILSLWRLLENWEKQKLSQKGYKYCGFCLFWLVQCLCLGVFVCVPHIHRALNPKSTVLWGNRPLWLTTVTICHEASKGAMGTWPNSLLGLLGFLWSSSWRFHFTMMKAYQGMRVFSACFTLLSLVVFFKFHPILPLSLLSHNSNIKKTPSQLCLMQFEARPAHFIKHCKTLSSTRVFMCNQMQQLAWLQLLLGLLHRSTWLDFSSAANSGGAFSLRREGAWGKSSTSSLVLPPGEGKETVGWENQMNFQLLCLSSLTLGTASLFFLQFPCGFGEFMPGTFSLTTECYGLLWSLSALLSHLGGVDEHCLMGRDSFPDPVPLCGGGAGSSAHLNGGASRGGSIGGVREQSRLEMAG